MLRALLLVTALCLLNSKLFAQVDTARKGWETDHLGHAGVRHSWSEYLGEPYLTSIDLTYKLSFEENLLLNYHFGMGMGWNRSFHISTTAGGALGSILMLAPPNNNASGSNAYSTLEKLGLLMMFIPEGIGYYEKVSSRVTFLPYLNLLSLEYRKNKSRDLESFFLSAEMGFEGHFHVRKNWGIGAFAAFKPIYLSQHEKIVPVGYTAGLMIRFL